MGRLMKTYLHWPIEILYFLPAVDLKNGSHNFKICLHFQQYFTGKLSLAYNKGFSYMLLISYYSFISKVSRIWLDETSVNSATQKSC